MSTHQNLQAVERQAGVALAGEAVQTGNSQVFTAIPSTTQYPHGHSDRHDASATDAPVPSSVVGRTSPASIRSVASTGSLSKVDEEQADLEEKVPEEAEPEEEDAGVLTGLRLYLVFLALMLCSSMFALDQSIVATAIPIITSDLRAFELVSWVVTGYFLTHCGLILLAGQILPLTKAKWVTLASIVLFELGSVLCAAANSMTMLIVGRAVQGMGGAGMSVAVLAIVVTITTLKQRPVFMSAFGFVFVLSSVGGPLLGGVLTQRLSWRWCFWINLPVGAIAAAAVMFLLPARDPVRHRNQLLGWAGVKKLDFIGTGLSLAGVTCILLGLQWGGNNYPWSNWRVILLFILGVVLAVAFVYWQRRIDQDALMPLALIRNRTQLAAMFALFMMMMGNLGGTYQLPLFYQVARGRTPEQSGIDIIPFMLSACGGMLFSGAVVGKTGRYWPWLVTGLPISAVGFGLLYNIDSQTPDPRLIGFQVLSGAGIGISFQQPLIAVQVEFRDRAYLIPQANGIVSYAQLVGGAIGVGIVNAVQSIFLNRELAARAADVPFAVIRQSPTAIYTALAPGSRQGAIDAYTKAITESFIPIIAGTVLALIAGMVIKNKSTLDKPAENANRVAV